MTINPREIIARRVAQELHNGDLVNLGIGQPTAVVEYIPEDVEIWLHSENGFIGLGPAPDEYSFDKDLVNAGGQYVTVVPGGSMFDSCWSFGIVRGQHVDVTVLGTLEVDQEGNIANYIIPGKMAPGMGGAMDLCVGAKKVIIMTDHCDKKGNPKIVKKCTLPLTAKGECDMIITELAVIERTSEGLVLKEYAPGSSVEEVVSKTGADLIIADDVKEMQF